MSRINVDALHSEDGGSSNIELDDSRNATCKGNLTVDGNIAVTGTGLTDTKSFRNLIINGAMQVAQRGTSSTSSGYYTVDRFKAQYGGQDEAVTQAQVSLTSSDTGPWEKGFRNALQLTNGNQTSGAGAGDYCCILYTVEAQDLANSGWQPESTSSKLTLSFWVKSSTAQEHYLFVRLKDGTSKMFSYSTGSLSANTWTKVTKTFPGVSGASVDDNKGAGLEIQICPYRGTDFTASGSTLDAWKAYDGTSRFPDAPTTWWTTNDATFAITGVQLEVGDTATDFEHRPFGDELARCQRYYYMQEGDANDYMCTSMAKNGAALYFFFNLPVPMRTYPSITGNASDVRHFSSSSSDDFACSGLVLSHYNTTWYWGNGQTTTVLYFEGANASGGQGGMMQCQENGVKLEFSAEL